MQNINRSPDGLRPTQICAAIAVAIAAFSGAAYASGNGGTPFNGVSGSTAGQPTILPEFRRSADEISKKLDMRRNAAELRFKRFIHSRVASDLPANFPKTKGFADALPEVQLASRLAYVQHQLSAAKAAKDGESDVADWHTALIEALTLVRDFNNEKAVFERKVGQFDWMKHRLADVTSTDELKALMGRVYVLGSHADEAGDGAAWRDGAGLATFDLVKNADQRAVEIGENAGDKSSIVADLRVKGIHVTKDAPAHVVTNSAVVAFDGAGITTEDGAGELTFVNKGTGAELGLSGTDARLGKVIVRNDAGPGRAMQAMLAIETGASAGDATIVNAGTMWVEDAKGGSANVLNIGQGEAHIRGTSDLESMQIRNDSTILIEDDVVADRATIINGINGVVDVSGMVPVELTRSQVAGNDLDILPARIGIGSLSGRGELLMGDTIVELGALGDDEFAGVLDSDASDDMPYAQLVKVGNGRLTLSGNNVDYNGGVAVSSGTVVVAHPNALGTGTVRIAADATAEIATHTDSLGHIRNAGTLDIGSHVVLAKSYQSAGTVDAKDRIVSRLTSHDKDETPVVGTLTVGGNSDMSNTQLVVETDVGARQLPKMRAGAPLVIAAKDKRAEVTGFVAKAATDPAPDVDAVANVVAQRTVVNVGALRAVSDGLSMTGIVFDASATVDPATVYSPNELAYLDSLADVEGTVDADNNRVGGPALQALFTLPAGSDAQRAAARQLSGEALTQNVVAAQGAARTFQRGLQSRMIAGGAMLNDETASATRGNTDIGTWAIASTERTDQGGGDQSFNIRSNAVTLGIDRNFGANTRAGFALGMDDGKVRANQLATDTRFNSVNVGGYITHLTDSQWFFNGAASYSHHNAREDRTVSVAGLASSSLEGKTRGSTVGLFAEVGHRFSVNGFDIDPSFGMRYLSTSLDGFVEVGKRNASAAGDGLSVGDAKLRSTRLVFGSRFSKAFELSSGTKVAPSLRIAYERELGKSQSSLTNAMYAVPGALAYDVTGPELGKNIFTADLGVDVQFKNRVTLHIGGNASVRANEHSLGGNIAALYRF